MTAAAKECPGSSGRSNPGQAGTGQNTAAWKYKPSKKRVELTNHEFLSHAFGRCGLDETPWTTGFPGDPGKVEPAKWAGRPALPLPTFIRDTYNNYVVVSTFKKADDGSFRRRKNCFAGLFVIMVDDIGTKVPFTKLHIEPTCLVETSPGNYQAWYFMREPERDRHRAERLLNGMIASGLTADGADPGMSGVTRYGRLPVGVNGKGKYASTNGRPFVQRVAQWAPHTRYSLDEIAAAFGVDLSSDARNAFARKAKTQGSQHAPSADGMLNLLEQAGLYLEPVNGTSSAHRIVCPWVHEHTDEDPTGTAYFEPGEENNNSGGFKCHHGHCMHRNIADLTHFVARLQTLIQD